ncbi:MAG: flagellar hook-associated protein FlgK [Marinagarivorans sp.]|nr:flagellar hook-associated protein FlgK [Marinagarivorans sp.]
MSGNLLGISVTGLKAAQTALSTTGHNIANADTAGYSRQRVDIVTNPALSAGGHFVGSGANIHSIERIANSFVTSQLRIDSSLNAELSTFLTQATQLDNLLSNESTGLTSGMKTFFSAMHNGADDPTSIPARELIVSEAENLADRFNSIDARMQVIEGGVNDALKVAVKQINALTENIAKLNIRIADAKGVNNSAQPNDLLDQRDEALRKLSELIPIQTFDQGNDQVNVMISGGMSLVVGNKIHQVSLESGRSPGSVTDIVVTDGRDGRVITNSVKGGQVGALIRFRDDTIYPAYNSLGRVASMMAETFNSIHEKGLTLKGDFGGQFFNDINDNNTVHQRVVGVGTNSPASDRDMSLLVKDVASVGTSNYTMNVGVGGSFKVIRESDGQQVASGLMNDNYPLAIKFDGLELAIKGGTFAAGDSFSLQPFTQGARNFERVIDSPEEIAFASPLNSNAEIGNSGSATISPGSVLSLTDNKGDLLAPFAAAGKMSPPMVVQFTSPTTYDILNNTDPANPQPLDPPIRNQRYIPGIENNLFSVVDGQTQVSMGGDLVGLPEGRKAVSLANVHATPVNAPNAATGLSGLNFSITNFSGANQFSFNVQLSDTVLGAKDTSTTVTVSGANISTEAELLQHMNAQLSLSGVRAYIAVDDTGNRRVGFKAVEAGHANITVGGYSGPANGSANALLNNALEGGASYSSSGGAFGVEGTGTLDNAYPSERLTIIQAALQPGGPEKTYTIFNQPQGSAKDLANELNTIPGVAANAFTYAQLSDLNVDRQAPLQISLNGTDLITYHTDGETGARVLAQDVPNPITDQAEFNQYLANAINSNPDFIKQGISAVAGQNQLTGKTELRVSAASGDDLNFALTARANQSVSISDGEHSSVALMGSGNDSPSSIVVGGKMDIRLAADLTLTTRAANSLLFGDTQAADFEKPTYLGLQVSIKGTPDTGDRFTLDFNNNAASDNRNALLLTGVETNRLLNNGTTSLNDAYGALVERIGITTNTAKINAEAAEAVLEQTTALRDSIAGVNLDEEASNLIRFEQFYQANAQVISVARNLFDALLGSF